MLLTISGSLTLAANGISWHPGGLTARSSVLELVRLTWKVRRYWHENIFYSHANKTHFHKKGFALGLVLEVRGFGTLKWPIVLFVSPYVGTTCLLTSRK